MSTEAFIYRWTDHKRNMFYVGSRKGNPNDGYICSSKLMLEQYNERPQDFTRHIIAEGAYWAIRWLEYKILQTADVKNNPKYYNQHSGNGDFYLKGHTKEAKRKISNAHKNIPQSEEHKRKNSEWHKINWSLECIEAMRKKNIGNKYTLGKAPPNKGKKYSQSKEAVENMSLDWIITFPDGHKEKIKNLRKFCKENNLANILYNVAYRKGKSRDGYKVEKAPHG